MLRRWRRVASWREKPTFQINYMTVASADSGAAVDTQKQDQHQNLHATDRATKYNNYHQ